MEQSKAFTSKKYDILSRFYDWIWRAYTRQTIATALAAANVKGTERICDIGCGTGALEVTLLKQFPQLTIDACDVSVGMLSKALQKLAHVHHINFFYGDFLGFEWPAGTYDTLFSLSNLHYFPDSHAVFRKAYAAAKPGGTFILVDWIRRGFKAKGYGLWMSRWDKGFKKVYSLEEVGEMFTQTGWCVELHRTFHVRWFWSMMVVRARKR